MIYGLYDTIWKEYKFEISLFYKWFIFYFGFIYIDQTYYKILQGLTSELMFLVCLVKLIYNKTSKLIVTIIFFG